MGFNFSYKDLIFDSCGLSETIKANLGLSSAGLSWLYQFKDLNLSMCV